MTQKEKIKDLEKQLEIAKRHTYVHETYRLHCNDGELYISHDNDKCVVFNVEQLYKDLPFYSNTGCKRTTENAILAFR